MRIAVLASTRGTDLQAIIDEIKKGELDADLRIVIADRECYAIKRAKKAGYQTRVIEYQNESREEYDRKIAAVLEKDDIDLICLVGYMRILSPWFVRKFKIMNIHPSLLPAFPGMDETVHAKVIEYGCKVTGCTIHFVDEGVDTGPIIMQECVPVKIDDTVETLKERVQELEKKMYPEAIRLFNKMQIQGRKVKI